MIDLTDLQGSKGTARILDFGSMIEGTLGGADQKLDRLGTRFEIDFESIPVRTETDGRRWIALLQQAKLQGGRVIYPQLGFNIGSPGSTLANGVHSTGTTLNVKGGTPYYTVRAGQALNVIKDGRRYLYFAAAQETLNGTGNGSIVLTCKMRKILSGDEVIDLKTPCVEGFIRGNEQEWELAAAQLNSFKFTIKERA